MANIDTPNSNGRRSVNHELPLVPFIDLLFCCIMFLLATAVWNQIQEVETRTQTPGPEGEVAATPRLHLQVETDGYVLASSAGDQITIGLEAGAFDRQGLQHHLQEHHRLMPNETAMVVSPDDGVRYQDVVEAMDIAVGAGFSEVSIGQ